MNGRTHAIRFFVSLHCKHLFFFVLLFCPFCNVTQGAKVVVAIP